MFDSRYWLWLSLIFETGSPLCDSLLQAFNHNPKSIYEADKEALSPFCKGNERLLERLIDKKLNRVYAILDFCQKENVGVLTPTSRNFPSSLLKIASQPLILYYKGRLPDFSRSLGVAVVGTRSVTPYGSSAAYTISHDLASSGATVVSGMALGADTAAHRGALDAGGHTVAFLGCGIDIIYPKDNARLMQEIIANGTVITEYAPGLPPEGRHFPVRNRLISGVSSAVLVIEAAEKSGALITASHALKQGKLLYAVPGKVGELSSTGTNLLIRNGAKMVTSAKDILSDFSGLYEFRFTENKPAGSPQINNQNNTLANNTDVKISVTEKVTDKSVDSNASLPYHSPDFSRQQQALSSSSYGKKPHKLVAAQPKPTVLYNGMTEEEAAASYMSMETEIGTRPSAFITNADKVFLTYPKEPMPEGGYEIKLTDEKIKSFENSQYANFNSELLDNNAAFTAIPYGVVDGKDTATVNKKSEKKKILLFGQRKADLDKGIMPRGSRDGISREQTVRKKRTQADVEKTEVKQSPISYGGLNETECSVLKLILERQPVSIDGMSSLGLSVSQLLSTVTMLEIKQKITQKPGGYFEIKK